MKGLKKLLPTNTLVSNKKANIWSRIKGLNDKYDQVHPYDSSPALIDTNLLHYTELRQFQAYLTKNSYDMSIFNEPNVWPHTNFGTIDNPNLIFGAGTTWRMVICCGPGSEEESSSHEKMYMIVREGPIHRCQFCGQCFKLVKLKDDVSSQENMYYSSVFTQISDAVVGHLEGVNPYTFGFTFNEQVSYQTNVIPRNRAYLFVNNDEGDRLMVDPAYRMKYYDEAEKYLLQQSKVYHEIERQFKLAGLDTNKIKMDKDLYETWFKIERDILHFDRLYNRYEKFAGRKMFDPLNHERREKRMLQKQHDRLNENYTYYLNGLTEQEQMYRDYYESDLEDYPENEMRNEITDLSNLRGNEEFDLSRYNITESVAFDDTHAPVEDYVDKLIFKYKYRHVSDAKFNERHQRMLKKFCDRAKTRDSRLVKDLGDRLEKIYVKKGFCDNITGKEDELVPHADYIASEGLQQLKDYYKSDLESGEINNDILDDLSVRDRLRFAECYVNELAKNSLTDKHYITIPKRPFDSKKSLVHNFVEDLIDFNYRVRPLIRNISFKDVTAKFQSLPMSEDEVKIYSEENDRYRKVLDFKKSGKTKADQYLTYKH